MHYPIFNHIPALLSGAFISTLPGTPPLPWTALAVVGLCELRDDLLPWRALCLSDLLPEMHHELVVLCDSLWSE
jgi:hypothetical protein